MIKLEECSIGRFIVLVSELNDPWSELKPGMKGKIIRIEPEMYCWPAMLHCVWDNGSTAGVFLDDGIELVVETT
jgi:hypothetical protein